jgi:crossover junction endodeoxyribonuclease RuvC
MITILGIDPGLASTGYGVIRIQGTGFLHITHGVIHTPANTGLGSRLALLHAEVEDLVQRYAPDAAGVEALFFSRNTSSAIPVAHAMGVILLALEQHGIPTGAYPPQKIKQALVGEGRAEKQQIQQLVRVVLGLNDLPGPDHASDALAVAICHAHAGVTEAAIRKGAEGAGLC